MGTHPAPYPGPLPPPPSGLSERELPVTSLPSLWFRCDRVGRDPVHFGRTAASRFDDPREEVGVLYAGVQAETAFVEVFGGALALSETEITARTVWTLVSVRPARLVDLTGEALPALGLDARISAADHAPAQAWSRALYDHPDQPDGLLYRSRRDPSRLAVALYDREPWSFEIAALPTGTLVQLAGRYRIPIV